MYFSSWWNIISKKESSSKRWDNNNWLFQQQCVMGSMYCITLSRLNAVLKKEDMSLNWRCDWLFPHSLQGIVVEWIENCYWTHYSFIQIQCTRDLFGDITFVPLDPTCSIHNYILTSIDWLMIRGRKEGKWKSNSHQSIHMYVQK